MMRECTPKNVLDSTRTTLAPVRTAPAATTRPPGGSADDLQIWRQSPGSLGASAEPAPIADRDQGEKGQAIADHADWAILERGTADRGGMNS